MGFHREGISGRWPGYINSSVAPLLTPSGMIAICISAVQSKRCFPPLGLIYFVRARLVSTVLAFI